MNANAITEVRPISLQEALNRVSALEPLGRAEEVELSDALFRVLAEEVIAPRPIPEQESAAMDGFAFRMSDLPADRTLALSGRVAAGHPSKRKLAPHTAVRIFTGGVIPRGADTVAKQEDCIFVNGNVIVPGGLKPGANRREIGEDIAAQSIVLDQGIMLQPQDIAMAAAVGRVRLQVMSRPRVAVITTGDELRRAGKQLPSGCVYDSNRYAVSAALRALGATVHIFDIIKDNKELIKKALVEAADRSDLVITSGGASVGQEDHVRTAILELGTLDFWRVAIRPGKPVAMGRINGVPFVGLPGNPVSTMVTFWLIARPVVLRLLGARNLTPPRYPVVAAFNHRHVRGLREFLRVRVSPDAEGILRAEPFRSPNSNMLSSLVWSDGLVEIGEDVGDVQTGDILPYLAYNALHH